MKVKIIGGLGNQMFQYASAYALAKMNNDALIADISDAIKYKTHPLRLTELACSARFEKKSFSFERYLYSNNIPIIIKKLIFPYCLIENGLEYDPTLSMKCKNKKLIGYFQCEKYFSAYRKELIQQFKPKAEFSDYQKEIIDLMGYGDSCSVHIRRGDYITNPEANALHGVCNKNYFDRALKYLKDNGKINDQSKIFLFSDDVEWCKENIEFSNEIIFIKGESLKVELDLWLMSKCKHNVISNSSFSWWAAWLNEHDEKCVVSPQMWFKSKQRNNIVPETWIQL
ncbi:alpha-1,2-fucosyltransferase [Pectobacterium punjabense]|uniref:alpha-1,2-fucosyltransferase n=1 Tax=Pectobacterium punjabense TaxID=2108399 RepID=UPI002B242267|nr:alpha-1,2-fucosyltransferase [Pectobacterium punjabense]